MTTTPIHWSATDRETLSRLLPDALVILPVGATEQHGRHLSTGTDALLAATTAEQAAERAAQTSSRPLVLAPTLPFGASDHHLPFGGTLSLTPETMLAVLVDLLRSIAEDGGRRVVLVNGHGGNVGACHSAAAAASTRYGLAVAYVDYWRLAGADTAPVPGHAGEFETSLVAAVRPDWIGDAHPRAPVPDKPAVADVDLYDAKIWNAVDGFTDRPEKATAADGSKRLEAIVDALSDRFVELASAL